MSAATLYVGAAEAWAAGADLVYGPLADALVAFSPVDLRGRLVVDVGAGTGAGSRALQRRGVRVVAADLAFDMVAHDAAARPPAVVADIGAMPLRRRSVDGVLAPFVLNHVDRPGAALAELIRCVAPHGVVLASSFAESDRPPVKDLVDAVAARHGWRPPPAYEWMKANAVPRCATVARFASVAAQSGLTEVDVIERSVDVGLSSPRDLVAYRLGMAHLSAFLAELPRDERHAVVAEAEAAVADRHDGSSLAPRVVLLAGRVA